MVVTSRSWPLSRRATMWSASASSWSQARERLLRTYEQMPEPKFVVSVGSCSISGGVFQGCYNVGGSTDEVIPVDVYIPGCPPRPEAIVDGIIQLLSGLKAGTLRNAQI